VIPEKKLVFRKKLTLGADPEIFAFKQGKLVPAFEFLPPKGEGRLMYWDGFQAEWKYREAWTCQNNFVKHTRESLMTMAEYAKQKGASLSLINVVRIPDETLQKAAYKHVELGCEPSYNAYEMRGKPVENPRLLKYRFTGGHMHYGPWLQYPNYERIVKVLDKILGVWAVGTARILDSPIRRQYYGMAGEYRKPEYGVNEHGRKIYGVEYRTLSNFWLSSPPLMQATWDIGRLCVKLAGTRFGRLWAADEKEVIETINNCDYQQANKILKRNEPMFKWLLGHQRTYDVKAVKQALTISYAGMHEFVGNVHDLPANWHFRAEWVPNAGAEWARFGV
jgi:Phage phiEco32-like COOH.NH2 ligase-type 2